SPPDRSRSPRRARTRPRAEYRPDRPRASRPAGRASPGPTGLPFRLRFSDAVDRHEPALARPRQFPREDRTVFPEQGAALRVADENVAAPRLRDHRGGHFSGERARAVLREVLGGKRPTRTRILRRVERRERRGERELAARDSIARLRGPPLRVRARPRARPGPLPGRDEKASRQGRATIPRSAPFASDPRE